MTTDARNLVSLVAQDGTVTGITSTIVHWPAAVDTTPPFITYRELSRRPATRLSGRPGSDSVLIELEAYARDTPTLKSLVAAIISAVELNSVVESIGPDIYDDDSDIRRQSVTASYHADR